MAKKCEICDENLEENEIGKLDGTVIKIKKDNKNELHYVCSSCQKKKKIEEIRKEIEES